jgi:hypothetical protein
MMKILSKRIATRSTRRLKKIVGESREQRGMGAYCEGG